MYLVKIINTNGITERTNQKTTPVRLPNGYGLVIQKTNNIIGGIKDKDCSTKNNLFNMDKSFS